MADIDLRGYVLALLSEGSAPGRRGIGREDIERILRAAGVALDGLDATLEALIAEQLILHRLGEWWAVVLGHRAGKRVPIAPELRASFGASVRASAEAARALDALAPPVVYVVGAALGRRDAAVILTTTLRLHFADLSREGQPGERIELTRWQADRLVAQGLARWPSVPEVSA